MYNLIAAKAFTVKPDYKESLYKKSRVKRSDFDRNVDFLMYLSKSRAIKRTSMILQNPLGLSLALI